MKPKKLTSILLFISAYFPLLLILAVKDFDFEEIHNFKNPNLVYTMLSIGFLSVIVLFLIFKSISRGNMPVEITGVSNRTIDLINYTIPYMLAFFDFDLSKWEDIISLVIFLGIMFVLTLRGQLFFINPMLAFIGYGLYNIDYKFNDKTTSIAVLSKFDIKKGKKYYIKSLTRFLYLVKEPVEL